MIRLSPVVGVTAILLGASMTGCAAKESTPTDGPADLSTGASVTVSASDTACELSATAGATGTNTFEITNNGSKVTEFYVYGHGDRVVGEVENITPGMNRTLIVQLSEPGTYQTACKSGMAGDGIRGDFTVTGIAVGVDTATQFAEAAASYKRYVNSQTDALIPATRLFVDAIKRSDIAAAQAQFPRARTYYERIEPVGESSLTVWTRASTDVRPTWSPVRRGRGSTASRRTCGLTAFGRTRRLSPIS